MKQITLQIRVQVPDDTDEKDVARSIDRVLNEEGDADWGKWKVGGAVIVRTGGYGRRP